MTIELAIPPPLVTAEEISEWYTLNAQLSALKEREMFLRKKICSAKFTQPREGTNNLPIENGYVMKMVHVVNRKLDIGQFELFRDTFESQKIPVNDIIENKPQLVVAQYKALTEEQRRLFDNCLTITDGSPQLSIVMPKRAVK